DIGPGNLRRCRKFASGDKHEFQFDRQGRLVAATTAGSKFKFAHDPDGRRVADLRDGLGVRHAVEFGTLRQTTLLDHFTVWYRREPNGTLVVRDPTGREHKIRSLGNGLVMRTMSSGTWEAAQFDRAGLCLAKVVDGSNSWFATRTWSRTFA